MKQYQDEHVGNFLNIWKGWFGENVLQSLYIDSRHLRASCTRRPIDFLLCTTSLVRSILAKVPFDGRVEDQTVLRILAESTVILSFPHHFSVYFPTHVRIGTHTVISLP